jgi:hypothetical protein
VTRTLKKILSIYHVKAYEISTTIRFNHIKIRKKKKTDMDRVNMAKRVRK